MRRLQLIYGLASTLWLVYYGRMFLAIPLDQRSPHFVRSFFLCLLVIVIVPATLGYVLLFKLAPWVRRRLNPAR